jgi:hypothetical protein
MVIGVTIYILRDLSGLRENQVIVRGKNKNEKTEKGIIFSVSPVFQRLGTTESISILPYLELTEVLSPTWPEALSTVIVETRKAAGMLVGGFISARRQLATLIINSEG